MKLLVFDQIFIIKLFSSNFPKIDFIIELKYPLFTVTSFGQP